MKEPIESPDSNSVAVDCPVCGNRCGESPLFRYPIDRAAAHFCPPERDPGRNERLRRCIGRLWHHNDSLIFRCGNCTFAFAWPFVDGDEEFYDILHEQQGYPSWRWDYDVAISEAVTPRLRGRILDIGAGTGAFLAGVDGAWEKYATEGGESTRRQLENMGIRVSRDLTELVANEAGTFDVVTMFQLLEHVADFRKLLIQCRQLLRADGKLVITVPHGDAMLRQERVLGMPDMPPFHVNKWTPKSLSRVLNELAFRHDDAVLNPFEWRNLIAATHIRVMADAAGKPGSLASQAYRIRRKSLRVPVLAALGIPAFARILRHIRELRLPGAFGMVASPN